MKFGAEEIQETAAKLGFRADTLEKVFRLLSLLETLRESAFLRPRVALKGGTALNLFLFDVPRLSVDIDLNYVGSADRDTMLADKPKVEQAIQAVCAREGLTVKRMPSEHAGGKWRLSFVNTGGSSDNLEVDLNFMLRVPLWPVTTMDSKALGPAVAKSIDLDRDKLRLAFVVYGGLNRKDWRTVRIEDVAAEPADLKRALVPMLRADVRPKDVEIVPWTEALVRETRTLMNVVLPLEAHELEFVERLNGAGDIAPELLTGDPAMQETIRDQPGLKWKAMNVKKQIGGAGGN